MLEHRLKHIPQVATAARKSGAIAAEIVIALLSKIKVRPFSMHNTYNNQLPFQEKISDAMRRYAKLAQIPKKLKKNTGNGDGGNTF
jgi:predicted HD phosphohydrolase